MRRRDCLEFLSVRLSDELVVTSQSGQRIEWADASQRPGNLLLGMMGCAIGVATGLAMALPHRRVIALDSDGSVLLSMFNLTTLGRHDPKNLTVIVFDNGVYSGTSISDPTATSVSTDLAGVARACGISQVFDVSSVEEFATAYYAAQEAASTSLLRCAVEESLDHRSIPRPTTDLAENKYTFARYIEQSEGITLPFIGRG